VQNINFAEGHAVGHCKMLLTY